MLLILCHVELAFLWSSPQVPIIVVGFAALGGAQIAPQVSAWIAVFVLPLNSSLNPLLYTMSALSCGR